MVEWLRTEFGGVILTLLGYALRALAENQPPPWRVVAVRCTMALLAGIAVLAALPSDIAPYWRVAAFMLVGATTPELVRLLTSAALKRVGKEVGSDDKPA